MKCPVCNSKNVGTTFPFASLLCRDCGFDEDFHNKDTYKPKEK